MNHHSNANGRTYGKGYYIALILCAAAIGISGYLYYRNSSVEPTLQNPDTPVWGANQEPSAPPATKPTVKPAEKPGEKSTEPVKPVEKKSVLKTGYPVEGKTIADYAMDCLSYNQTTRDWRTHDGIDIAAEAGTPVLAAADGVVYTVCEDDAMGTTVVIRHEGGYTTCYASLEKDPAVKSGDPVKLGQPIGKVGETALIETALGPHVHFSVSCHDKAMNPSDFLK